MRSKPLLSRLSKDIFVNRNFRRTARTTALAFLAGALAISGLADGALAAPGVNDVSIGNATVVEVDQGGSVQATFTVTRSGTLVGSTTVEYTTVEGTATEPEDFVAASGTIVFQESETTKDIVVTVNGDDLDEADETFTVVLSQPQLGNANIVDGEGLGTITDDDPLPAILISDRMVDEDKGPAEFTVTLSAVSGREVSVNYTTVEGTATSGEDFTTTSGTLVIPAGQTSGKISVPIINDARDEESETFSVSLSNASNATLGDSSGAGTITDNDATPTLSVTNTEVTEGNLDGDGGPATTNANVDVVLSAASGRTVTVQYTTTNGTATAGSDYTTTSGMLTFQPGETTKAIVVPVLGDAVDEPNETVVIDLSAPTGGVTTATDGTLTILDDEGTPSLSVADISVPEGDLASSTATFTIRLSHASSEEITVDYSVNKTGTGSTHAENGPVLTGGDFFLTGGKATFAPGELTREVDVTVHGDSKDELDETFRIVLSNPSPDTITIADPLGIATIVDDDDPTISVSDGTGAEGAAADDGKVVFVITLSDPALTDVTVAYTTVPGTATEADYTPVTGTHTFLEGETSKEVTVDITNDALDELDETFTLRVTRNEGDATIGDGDGTGTITDDDPTPSIAVSNPDVTEGGSLVFQLSLSAPSGRTVTVDYATAPGTATDPADYAGTTGTATFAPGEIHKFITVTTVDDNIDEDSERMFLDLDDAVGATIADEQGVGTIADNDDPPTVSVNDTSATEGNVLPSTATFTVSLSRPSSSTVTVAYATADGTATAGQDYTTKSGTVSFAAGETSKPVEISVLADTTDEADETFFVNLTSPTNATLGDAQGVGTILDDDGPTISVNDVTTSESGDAVFEVTLSAASLQEVRVQYATSGGTATAGSDYTPASGTLTFAPGETKKQVPVDVTDDASDEPDETFNLVLSNPSGATIADGTGVATITDNDDPAISINDVLVPEANQGTSSTATFTVSLSSAGTSTITVKYTTADGTATAPADYVPRVAPGTVEFAPGETSKTITVTVVGDNTDEADETFLVNLSDPTNATIADGSGTATIDDNDGPTIAIGDANVAEGDSGSANATFTVTLTGGSGAQDVKIDYTTVNVTATSGSDYTATTGTLTIPAGSTTGTIAVPVLGDTRNEETETFFVRLSNAVDGTITDAEGTGTISDNDPIPSLSIADLTTAETNSGTKSNTFTVTLSAASGREVKVDFATSNGTATAPTDYTATAGTLTFAAGETSKPITVVTRGDTVDETNETFTVTLSDPVNATIADASATGTITDDDEPQTSTTTTTTTPDGGGSSGQGYSLVGEDGSLYAFGTAKNVGDMKGKALNAPIIGVAYTPGGNGYWLVAKDGGIFTFGDADFFGSMGDKKLNSPIIGMAATPTGKGYWLFAGDGGIFTFGDADFFGSMGDKKLNAPVINMEPLESGNGYWLVAADGGIFTFGQAEFFGSMGDQKINQPVFDMTSTDTDDGYWLVARDGGIFSFGDAAPKFYGSAVNETPRPTKVIGMDSTPGSLGYWIADANGKVYEYGNAQDLGDRYFSNNPAPMISFASVPGLKP